MFPVFSAKSRESAQKARHVEEFLQRKKEAAMNRARGGLGVAGAIGARPVSAAPTPTPSATPAYKPPSGRPVSARDAHREQQEDVRF